MSGRLLVYSFNLLLMAFVLSSGGVYIASIKKARLLALPIILIEVPFRFIFTISLSAKNQLNSFNLELFSIIQIKNYKSILW